MQSQTPEQRLLSKLYEYKDELDFYINTISVNDIKEGKQDLHYTTILTLLTTKKDLNELVNKLEKMICDKQDLM